MVWRHLAQVRGQKWGCCGYSKDPWFGRCGLETSGVGQGSEVGLLWVQQGSLALHKMSAIFLTR